ncbi:MAG: hypothetical protein Kow0092_09120 [Deferrisomatales bacterium]
MRPLKKVCPAYSSSKWIGLQSPVAAANKARSSGATVWVIDAVSPTVISPAVRHTLMVPPSSQCIGAVAFRPRNDALAE